MRSKLVVCAALAGTCLFGSWSPVARAADPKGKAAKGKAKTGDGLTDDKVISKQMQWEDSVMGPDDGKKAELEKIARAQAINKAAAEKAAREKEKADAQAAKEAASPKSQTAKRGGDVAIPSVSDEPPARKVETAEAPPPPPVKHGDDKFIDKLLKDDGGAKKHKSIDDKALNDLLAVEKPGAKPKRKDDVDSLLQSADKAPPMPETHVRKEVPEWARPEIESTPQPTPVVLHQQPKRNDGVIRVVQGAANPARTIPASTTAPSRNPAVAGRVQNSHQPAASDGSWNDPFASGQKKTVAARDTRHSSDFDDGLAPSRRHPAAPPARGSAADFDDPVKAAPKPAPAPRRATPAKPNKWKDPFTEDAAPKSAPTKSVASKSVAHPAVAARTPKAPAASGWSAARPRGVQVAASDSRAGGWGALKKHAR